MTAYLSEAAQNTFNFYVNDEGTLVFLGTFATNTKGSINGKRLAHEYDKDDIDRLHTASEDED